MAEFTPSKIDLDSINNGKLYKNGDGVQAETLNDMVKAVAYAQSIATNQPDISEANNYGTPSVSIVEDESGVRLKFSNLKDIDHEYRIIDAEKAIQSLEQGHNSQQDNIMLLNDVIQGIKVDTTEIKKEINDLYVLSNATVTGTETVHSYGTFTTRKTGYGNKGDISSSLIDGSLTRVKWIQGKTVVGTDGLLKNAYFKGIKSTGKNLVNIPYITLTSGMAYEEFEVDITGKLYISFVVDTDSEPLGSALFYLTVNGQTQYLAPQTFGERVQYKVCLDIESQEPVHLTKIVCLNWGGYEGKVRDIQVDFATDDWNNSCPCQTYEAYKEDISFMLNTAQEMGAFDGINPIINQLRKSTELITFTGNEDWKLNVVNTEVGNPYAQFYFVLSKPALGGNVRLPIINRTDIFNVVDVEPLRPNKCFITANGNWFVISTTTDIDTVDKWKAYLSSLAIPLQIAYSRQNVYVSTSNFYTNKYQVWANGSETAVQGDIDNGEHGATVATEQTYAVIKGAIE